MPVAGQVAEILVASVLLLSAIAHRYVYSGVLA